MGIVFDMIKTGIIISLVMGFFYLVYWSMKKNIKYFMKKFKNRDLIDWIKDGLKKGYTDEQLSKILLDQNYKPKIILKSFMKSKRELKKELNKKLIRDKKILKELEGGKLK